MLRFGLLAAFGLTLLATSAHAQTVESALSPGKLIRDHADVEDNCAKCHVRFNRAAQVGLCLECHKDTARDVQTHQGYHGRLKDKECRTCHTDHKGREMNIAAFDPRNFDHHLTDFALKFAHAGAKIDCKDCHVPGKKFRDAPSDCIACHKKDDKHKGSLGPQCADCHTEINWKKTRFDHSKTRFPLTGKHRDVPCRDCHADPKFKGAPMQCLACHRKDDTHKGRFGTKCESCHTDKDWKGLLFNHDRDTKYPLRGKHRLVKCESCHTGFLYKEKLQSACIACHKKDDDTKGHKGRYGEKCQICHGEKDWKLPFFDHNRDTKYPLRGKHAQAKCDTCHTGNLYRDKLSTTCFACHEKDDKHKGQEGKKCESCHNETSWTKTRFDHGLSRFPLLGKHADVACKKCHLTPAYKDAGTACIACHEKDDKHKFTLGPRCETCHNALSWKAWRFDHDKQTSFKLDGGHKGIACDACHKKPMPRKLTQSSTCVSCHEVDDVHNGGFGKLCERCHVSSSFKNVRSGVGGAALR